MRVPKCENIGKRGPLPPLLSHEGLTDYPEKGDNLKIDFKNSKYALFPLDVAEEIALAYPKAWCAGGNYFGNFAFDYWVQTIDAINNKKKIPEECLRWIKKRELYIARHRQDFRLAGVIAMIKWAGFVDGSFGKGNGSEDGSSLNFMLETIERYGK